MVKRNFLMVITLALSFFLSTTAQTKATSSEEEALGVIQCFSNKELPVTVSLSLDKTEKGCDKFSTQVSNGTLNVKGSSGVAACRAFYEYVRSKGMGINSWTGNRFNVSTLTDEPLREVTSPYRDHYYMNVVTYGYTMAFWNQERWDREIDWMALHGIDMPLMLVANEAITRRTFKKIGLTDAEIDEYFVGPAYLPWMRMGNLSGKQFDGPLTEEWHNQQIQLAHHLLKRMHNLGMKPICPAFAGFVPKVIQNHFPNAKIEMTTWAGYCHNWRLDPTDSLFYKIGSTFIKEWEKEFGKEFLYLSDSFNEMAIPNDLNKLTEYGEKIYKTISDVNPDAKWVIQGWMFGYQRNNWNNATLPALLKNVPDDKMMILDMASDYNKHFWHNGYDWDVFNGFYGKEWVWSVIPNMGGKNAPTGVLEYYANGRLDALKSSHKGNLTGYGFAPEGIENNELIYELLTDGGWTTEKIDLDAWLQNYSLCRYGESNDNLNTYYSNLRKSVYGSFTDHPRYSWQFRPSDQPSGSVLINKDFFKAIDAFVLEADKARQQPLLRHDLIETVAFYTSAKIQNLNGIINTLLKSGEKKVAEEKIALFRELMLDLDALLYHHPNYSLEKWEQMAKAHSSNANDAKRYAKSARRLVSIWEYENAVPVRDYSARIWSGLIRDYYLPRWEIFYKNALEGSEESIVDFENKWVNQYPVLSQPQPINDVVDACLKLYEKAKAAVETGYKPVENIEYSTDENSYWYVIRSAYENTTDYVLTDGGYNDVALDGAYAINSGRQMWRLIKTDENSCRIEGRYGRYISSTGNSEPVVCENLENTNMIIRKCDNQEWNILPAKQKENGLHMSQPGPVTVWSAAPEIRGSRWIFENVDNAMVPEPVGEDYDRLIATLEKMRNGQQIGEAYNVEDVDNAIKKVKSWADDISHSSYNDFLKRKSNLLKSIRLASPIQQTFKGTYAIRICGPGSNNGKFLTFNQHLGRSYFTQNFNYCSSFMKIDEGTNSWMTISNYDGNTLTVDGENIVFRPLTDQNLALKVKGVTPNNLMTEDTYVLLATDKIPEGHAPYSITGLHANLSSLAVMTLTFPSDQFYGFNLLPIASKEEALPLMEEIEKAKQLNKEKNDPAYTLLIKNAEKVLNSAPNTKEDLEAARKALMEYDGTALKDGVYEIKNQDSQGTRGYLVYAPDYEPTMHKNDLQIAGSEYPGLEGQDFSFQRTADGIYEQGVSGFWYLYTSSTKKKYLLNVNYEDGVLKFINAVDRSVVVSEVPMPVVFEPSLANENYWQIKKNDEDLYLANCIGWGKANYPIRWESGVTDAAIPHSLEPKLIYLLPETFLRDVQTAVDEYENLQTGILPITKVQTKNHIYDLSGRIIKHRVKGKIYIQNGKKLIMR